MVAIIEFIVILPLFVSGVLLLIDSNENSDLQLFTGIIMIIISLGIANDFYNRTRTPEQRAAEKRQELQKQIDQINKRKKEQEKLKSIKADIQLLEDSLKKLKTK